MLIPDAKALTEIVNRKIFPVTYSFSRLEGRPFADNFERALRAEVRDPLWMLCKQWQMGEFEADDAGSPVSSKLCASVAHLDHYRADSKDWQTFPQEVPFEAKVEQRAIPFKTISQSVSLDLRLLMGRHWMQILKKAGVANTSRTFFLNHFGIKKPDPAAKEDAFVCAHLTAWQQVNAVAGKMIDGWLIYDDLANPTRYYNLPDFPLPGDIPKFIDAEKAFKSWFRDLFYQPEDTVSDAWLPERLEYQFSISANTGQGAKTLNAEAYYQGHLDWYNVNLQSQSDSATTGNEMPVDPDKVLQTFIPSPVMFDGMPNTRWWAFEDSKTNFGYVKPDTTDLAKLLLIEFGLVYANDWFMVPLRLPIGSLTKIKGLSLTNSFGEYFWIEPAGSGSVDDWKSWNMFGISADDNGQTPTDNELLLLPTVAKVQEAKPFEEVVFIRDEMANMVWGIETVIPLPSGASKSGYEAANEYHAYLQKLITNKFGVPDDPVPVKDGEEEAKIRYEIMNEIPENWIPFIPAHVKDNNREVQLQRAAMPRILEGNPDKPEKIRPRTNLLQTNLDKKAAYFIHEEEVPRAGIRVEQSFQRTRSPEGKVFVWFGARKTTGRGEGSSGLAFDRILPSPYLAP